MEELKKFLLFCFLVWLVSFVGTHIFYLFPQSSRYSQTSQCHLEYNEQLEVCAEDLLLEQM